MRVEECLKKSKRVSHSFKVCVARTISKAYSRGRPAAGHFFLLAQEKCNQKEGHPLHRPSGSLAPGALRGAAQLALAARTKRGLPRGSNSARLKLRVVHPPLSGAAGAPKSKTYYFRSKRLLCLVKSEFNCAMISLAAWMICVALKPALVISRKKDLARIFAN